MEVDKVCTSMLFDNQHSSAETRRQSMFNGVSSFYSSSYGHKGTGTHFSLLATLAAVTQVTTGTAVVVVVVQVVVVDPQSI